MRMHVAVTFCFFSAALFAEIPCPCDVHDPDTLRLRECSLCEQVEKAPPELRVIFIHDSSPVKPDRLLALPRSHSPGLHRMSALSDADRIELWRAAIAKAKELWGDQWGVAYNAEALHSQCHVHVHIGKLLDGIEWGEFKVVDSPDQIPLPGKDGLWIHPVDGKLHVHIGEQVTETVLFK
jgi:diadenosine tetraphosphate (Ap4A) HIT family hydrolase